MKGLKYLIIAFLALFALVLVTTPSMAQRGDRGSHGGIGHRGGGGHRGHYYKHHYRHGYYRPYYKPYGYYWSYLIPPLVFGALSYYQYQRPVYYPTYPRPVSQQVIIGQQTPIQTLETQAVPQEQSGTYQMTVKDKYGNPQTVNIPTGQTVTVSKDRGGEVQIIVVEPPTPQRTQPQGNPIEGYNQDGSPRYESSIPLKQTDTFGMGW